MRNIQVEKNVFVVFYSGERAKNKIFKICEAFGANRYPFPEELSKQAQMIMEVCYMPMFCLLFLFVCCFNFFCSPLLKSFIMLYAKLSFISKVVLED